MKTRVVIAMKSQSKFIAFLCILAGGVLSLSSYAKDLSKNSLTTDFVRLEGVFSQGGMLKGKTSSSTKVYLNDVELRVNHDGEFVFGFGRDAKARHTLTVVGSTGEQESVDIELIQRSYKTQSIEGVPQKTVTPSKDKLKRIREETALVKDARRADSDLQFFLDRFTVPIEAPITGVYGSQRIYNGVPKRPHFGVDYAAPTGSPVFAPAGGVVTLVHEDMYYSGGTLIVDHGFGISSTFIHLSEVVVEEGQTIKQGQLIAKVGAGGRSTGPHLDWRVNWYSTRLDPQLVLLTSN